MPIILCIETATKLCSVALARDGIVLASRDPESDKHVHAEKVNVFVAEVLDEAGLTLADLDAVAVGIGPGSYTGLRIGLSAAKGLCFALDIPIIGIGTLTTLMSAAKVSSVTEAMCWPMIDARRMEVFTQPFDLHGNATAAPAPLVIGPEWTHGGIAAVVFGDGADKAAEVWSVMSSVEHLPGVRPHASAMATEAMRRFERADFDDLAYLVPEYGKAANVTQPKKKA